MGHTCAYTTHGGGERKSSNPRHLVIKLTQNVNHLFSYNEG